MGALALVGACALGLRWHAPRPEVFYPDAAVYMRQAEGYLDGQGSIAPPWWGMPAGGPVYPALTALVTPLAGDTERAGVWVSRTAGVALALGTAGLALVLGGPVAALAAGLLVAVEPRLVHLSETDLTEPLFFALLLGALAWARRLHRSDNRDTLRRNGPARLAGWGSELGLGALLGTVALTRAVGLVFLPAVAVALIAAGRLDGRVPWRPLATRAARVLAGGLLVLGLYQGYAWSDGWVTAFDTHVPAALVHKATPEAPGAEAPGASGARPPAGVGEDVAAAEHGTRVVGGALARQAEVLGRMLPAPLWALALLGLVVRLARFRRREIGADLIVLGAAGAYLLGLALFGTALGRYLLVLFPLVFLYAGLGLRLLGDATLGVARFLAPGSRRLAPGAALALVAVAGGAVTEQVHASFVMPERGVAEVRDLAEEVTDRVPLAPPVAVYADHAFLPYYLNGYWRGRPVAAERARRLGTGSRVVVLDSRHADRWPAGWRGPALERTDHGGFYLCAQRYFPAVGQLLTVYVDAPPAPAEARGDGMALLREGRLEQAARALKRDLPDPAARRGMGVIEMVAGQFFPQRLKRAWDALRPTGSRGADSATAPVGTRRAAPRWPWSFPPGEVVVAADDAAAAWNRMAVALALGRPAEAARDLATVGRAYGDDPRALYLDGLTMLELGRVGKAVLLLKSARAALPDDPGVAVAWANAMATSGRYARAAPVYREILDREPENVPVWLNLIQSQLAAGDLGGAGVSIAATRRLSLQAVERERLDLLGRRHADLMRTRWPQGTPPRPSR